MITDPLYTDMSRELYTGQFPGPAGRGMSHVTATAGRWIGPVSAQRADSIATASLQKLGLEAIAAGWPRSVVLVRPAALRSNSWGLRLSLTLPCTSTGSVVQ